MRKKTKIRMRKSREAAIWRTVRRIMNESFCNNSRLSIDFAYLENNDPNARRRGLYLLRFGDWRHEGHEPFMR